MQKNVSILDVEKYILLLNVLFFTAVGFSFWSYGHIALLIEIILLCTIPVCAFLFRHAEYAIRRQMLGLNLFFLCIWIAGIFCGESNKSRLLLVVGGLICLLTGSIINLSYLYKDLLKKLMFKKHIGLLLVCILYVGLSINTIKDVPIYDSGAYYAWSITKLAPHFNFTLDNIFDYCLAGHISVGYGLFALLGELFNPFTASGVHFVNVVLAVMSIIAFYKVLEHIFPDYSAVVLGMASAIYAFSPYMLGMAGIINIDNPGIYIFVIMLYCYISKYRIYELFWAWVFVCTKEPHVIYYMFYIMGIMLVTARSKGVDKKFLSVEWIKQLFAPLVCRCVPIACWFVYYIAPGRNSWVASTEGLINSNGLHTIGFSIENTIIKLKELLILNFNWIFVLAILVGLFFEIRNKEQSRSILHSVVLPIILCLSGVLVFNLFYLDYPHPRYMVLGAEIVVILGIILFLSIKRMKESFIFLFPFVILAVISQSYVTIDPLTRVCFKSINYAEPGVGMVTVSGYKLDDGAIYNREYSYYCKALEESLRQMEYTDNTILVFPGYENIPRTYGYSENFLWNVTQKRIQTNRTDETIPIHIASEEEELEGYTRIIYMEPCFFQSNPVQFNQKKLKEKMEVRYNTMLINVQVYVKK